MPSDGALAATQLTGAQIGGCGALGLRGLAPSGVGPPRSAAFVAPLVGHGLGPLPLLRVQLFDRLDGSSGVGEECHMPRLTPVTPKGRGKLSSCPGAEPPISTFDAV